MSGAPKLTDADAERLAALLREAFGWDMPKESRITLETRLARRLGELSLPAFSDYVWLLTYDRRRNEELQHVADLLSVRETYFFREQYQLRALSDEIFPALAKTRRSIRIWSAGCATGEEAWTLAILAAESKALEGCEVEVFGSDLSPLALAAARRGEYDDAALRQMPPWVKHRWLERKNDRWSVADGLRDRVRFGRLNLASDPPPPGRFDVVVCRNVIIYFSGAAKKRVARTFVDALHPGGWLLLGHAESLVSVTTEFELVTLQNDLVYRRPGGLENG